MKLSLGYMTFPTQAEARNTVLTLLEEKLIACANLLPGAESLFVWEGEMQQANEVVVFFKTRRQNEEKIVKLVREMHSYECPCVVFAALDNGNPEFMEWVEKTSKRGWL